MNEWVPVIKDVKESIVRIVLFSEGEIVSEGTGTIINKFGWVVTASHVVDMFPDYEKYKKECVIYVFTSKGRLEYSLGSTPISIGIDLLVEKPLVLDIDIAILSPINLTEFDKYLPPVVNSINVEMGTDLLMCGYSEETPDLIDIAQAFSEVYSELEDSKKNEFKLIQGSLKPPTFKSGILSHTTHIYSKNPSLHYQFLHIDNGAHGGMSGGPIVDSNGSFIGIITQRTVVSSNLMSEKKIMKFEVPSGNSIGITLNILSLIEGFQNHYNGID